MKKVVVSSILIIVFLAVNPVMAIAGQLTETEPLEQDETTTLLSESEVNEYTQTFSEEEKSILLDSIQVIRAILVFIFVCIIFRALLSFLEWFF